MFYRILVSFFFAIFVIGSTFALIDPEPNPFKNILDNEQVFEATITEASNEVLSVENTGGETFSGRIEAISKYRDGGGPAAENEFFAGDEVRVLIDSENVILAIQNFELRLCDQTFYGWVRKPTENNFKLETIDGENFEVLIGSTTQFRNENSKRLFGYSPLENNIVKVHGVVNSNVKKIFTETFGTYISLLDENALAPFLDKVEERKEKEKATLEAKLAEQIFDDVSPENEFFFAINFITNEKIVNGREDGKFDPNAKINRAEFTKILVGTQFATQVTEYELPAKNCFLDFEKSDWFAPFVCFAKENEIISGYNDGTFLPANPVNLAEAVTILIQTFGFSVEENANTEWFEPFLKKVTELKILPDNFDDASINLTRGQMAEMVMRALKYQRGELVNYLANLKDESEN